MVSFFPQKTQLFKRYTFVSAEEKPDVARVSPWVPVGIGMGAARPTGGLGPDTADVESKPVFPAQGTSPGAWFPNMEAER